MVPLFRVGGTKALGKEVQERSRSRASRGGEKGELDSRRRRGLLELVTRNILGGVLRYGSVDSTMRVFNKELQNKTPD